MRSALAGAGLLLLTGARRRPLRTDAVLAGVPAALPFATTYGLGTGPTRPSSTSRPG